MKANYHTHTSRCHHAFGEDREYVETAISAGLKVLGFADHCPWDFGDGYKSGIRMTPQEIDGYFKSLTDLKNEYFRDITIYIGYESEYIPELMSAQDKLLADYPVDYMIIGEHFVSREPYGIYTAEKTSDEGFLKSYVDTIIEGMESGRYKYVAHPDLLNFVGSDEVYEKHFNRLCSYFKSKNIPIEINVLGVTANRHYPCDKFLKIAQKVGNSAIIGIDAHVPEALSDMKSWNDCRKLAEKYELSLVDYLPELGPISIT